MRTINAVQRVVNVIVLVALWVAGGIVQGQMTVAETSDATQSKYGALLEAGGWVHFGVFAPEATEVSLLLYDKADAKEPKHVVPMKKSGGKDWRVRVRGSGIGAGLLYMFRAKGPRDVSVPDPFGLCFNEHYPLSDPYAYDTQNVSFSRLFSATPLVDAVSPVYAGGGKSIVYDHAKDPHPGHVKIKPEDLIIYELHVQDYTARILGLDAAKRGTYLGLATGGLKTPGGLAAGIDHLVDLGVNAVELMPVMEYDEETGNKAGRLNHWGYMTTNFFAPETRYASVEGNDVIELKQLIKAFHDRGIAVILDTVYNHTGEGGPFESEGKLAGKYYNFRGLMANSQLYRSTFDGRFFFNNTGTGNDIDFSGKDDRFSKRLTTESLEMWHKVYGIDGFRFDLARILADGSENAADWVDNDPDFAGVHLHAEPWDLGGVWYDFMDNMAWNASNNRWAKWLGKYRDKVRLFSKSALKDRTVFKRLIEGQGDTGGGPASSKPWRSINVLAVHDGYTLRDLTFFNDDDGSHNAWDSNRDENLRREREKLLTGILLTSQGVPLILQGDEFGRTQAGALSQGDAHNTYNYESVSGDAAINNVNWIDWRLKDGDNTESPKGPKYGKELFGWTKGLIQLRKKWTHFRRAEFAGYAAQAFNGGADSGAKNDGRFSYTFEGPGNGEPTQLAVIWWGKAGEPDVMVIYNERDVPLTIGKLRDWSRGDWKVLARSWFGDDADFGDVEKWQTALPDAGNSLEIKGRSLAILLSDND